MELDPHSLQQVLQKIYQQMRCPQCGKKVPVDFESVRVVADEAMLLHLNCDQCAAHIVLQASLNGVENIGAPPYEHNETANVSSDLKIDDAELKKMNASLRESGGSFDALFKKLDKQEEAKPETDIA